MVKWFKDPSVWCSSGSLFSQGLEDWAQYLSLIELGERAEKVRMSLPTNGLAIIPTVGSLTQGIVAIAQAWIILFVTPINTVAVHNFSIPLSLSPRSVAIIPTPG